MSPSNPLLATSLCGIELGSPLVNGSGTLDAQTAGTLGLAAYVTKTVTRHPREGNPPPRIAETPSGMVNSIGLANPGLDVFLDRHLPRLAGLGVPLIVSVGGWSHGEYATAVERLSASPSVAAIELNVSCPNVDSGCISIGADAEETRALVELCRTATELPLLVKLSPSVADVAAIAEAAEAGGASGLVMINTVRGMAIDRHTLQPLLGGGGGGLSGPAVKPVGLHAVYHCRARTTLPIVGMGGVAGAQDAIEYLAAGASVVGLGTALFRDPGLPARLAGALAEEVAARGLRSVTELVGMALQGEAKALPKL
ncbi:MAG: dihydroorotate dehydrogenase [Gaiellales bacterium]